jgi:thiamine kinase-like enzyme
MKSLSQSGSLISGFVKLFSVFLDTVKTLKLSENIIEKISKWDMKELAKSWTKVVEPMSNGFVVLTHGDPWVNNILLSSNDVSFIDFQMSFWERPSADLIYFLVTSVADEVKAEYFDELIKIYHLELVDSLEKLRYFYSIPTLKQIHDDVLEKSSFGEFLLDFKNKILVQKS